ncbi:hypothetical protein ATCC90586_010370 [Pythium insidiosum]|nr:hypothetical protein ATCC90586_010370 [Pythium insidiosum]
MPRLSSLLVVSTVVSCLSPASVEAHSKMTSPRPTFLPHLDEQQQKEPVGRFNTKLLTPNAAKIPPTRGADRIAAAMAEDAAASLRAYVAA